MPKRGIGAYQPGDGSIAGTARGKNYLLVVGIDKYRHFPQLNNAVRDAKAFAALLQERYQFEPNDTEILFDESATERNLIHKLRDLARLITPDDNLVIYFSGHGEYDEIFKEGYWIPVDAEEGALEDFVANSKINTVLNAIRSRHTFLVIDSCFSGSLFMQYRSVATGARLEALPSRWGLSSGRNEVVPDGPAGQHSPFAESLLAQLRYNETDLGVGELCQRVVESVEARSRQIPRGEPLRVEGHEGGQFFFRLRQKAQAGADAQAQPLAAAPTRGGLLYSIPRAMELHQESRCEVRIAFDKTILLQDFEEKKEHEIRDIRISNLMQVELLDPTAAGNAFAVRTISSAEQFIDPDDYTEWIFYVKALREGRHPLVLKVTVIENREGRERKREIVLEENVEVRSQLTEIPEPSPGFTMGYAIDLGAVQPPPVGALPESMPPPAPQPLSPAPVFEIPPQAPSRRKVRAIGWVRALAAVFAILLGVMVVFRFFVNPSSQDAGPLAYEEISAPLIEARKSLEKEEPDLQKVEELLRYSRELPPEEKAKLPDTLIIEMIALEDMLARRKLEFKPREFERIDQPIDRIDRIEPVAPERRLRDQQLADRIKSGEERVATSPSPNVFTDQRDGKKYPAVSIAKRYWLQSNLAYQTEQAVCYQDRPVFCQNFGGLYTRAAAIRACPPGWRLPTAEDWDALVKVWGGYDKQETYRALIHGGPSFFQAQLAGRQDETGAFRGINEEAYFWTDSPIRDRTSLAIFFDKKEQTVRRVPVNVRAKLSCRCVKE